MKTAMSQTLNMLAANTVGAASPGTQSRSLGEALTNVPKTQTATPRRQVRRSGRF